MSKKSNETRPNNRRCNNTKGDRIHLSLYLQQKRYKNNGISTRNNSRRKILNHNQKKYNNNTNERLLRPIYPLQIKKYEIDYKILKETIERTSDKRESQETMKDSEEIIEDIKEDSYLRFLWEVYFSENKYIGNLKFDKVVDVVRIISNRINEM